MDGAVAAALAGLEEAAHLESDFAEDRYDEEEEDEEYDNDYQWGNGDEQTVTFFKRAKTKSKKSGRL